MRNLFAAVEYAMGMGNVRRPLARLLVGLLAVALPSLAAADSIHLKNGRVIRTPRTEVVGDKLVFLQYGAEITIPMNLVDRIETDAEMEEAPSPPRSAMTQADDSAADSDGDEDAAEDGEDDEVPAEDTRAYWRARVEEIAAERAALQAQIVDYRREERAFLFSHRSTADTRHKIEAAQERLAELDVQMQELRRDARRQGIPPGWLRGT